MAVNRFLREVDGLFNYSTDENPTTQQEYQEAVKNWVDTIKSLVDAVLWQPETEYVAGSQLLTPSLPYHVLRCTTGGTSGSVEPDYTDVSLGDTITDGTVTWVVDGYLPLSGGTITGPIYNGAGVIIRRPDNTGFTQINAGTDDTSPYISMYGKSHTDSAGEINLRAINSTNDKRLQLKPNGSMTWGGVSLTDGTFLTAKTTTVSARSGTPSYSITAPAVSGYQFVCWVMSASNGNTYPTYIANATSSSATVWAINPTNNTSIVCTALYVRKW